MKLIYCLQCADIFAPGERNPNCCKCFKSVAKWIDPKAGTLNVACSAGQTGLRVIGLNNSWIRVASHLPNEDLLHRHHNERTSEEAEGYLFKTRNCPVIMMTAPMAPSIFYDEGLLGEMKEILDFIEARSAQCGKAT